MFLQLLEDSRTAERLALTASVSTPTKTGSKKGVTLSLQQFHRGTTHGELIVSGNLFVSGWVYSSLVAKPGVVKVVLAMYPNHIIGILIKFGHLDFGAPALPKYSNGNTVYLVGTC